MSPDDLIALAGREIGVSNWIAIDQPMIDAFADVTFDRQFIHVDPAAAASGPFVGTVAHGFLTLSLITRMQEEAVPRLDGQTHGVNYGFDRIRFIQPVRAGSRIRGRFFLAEVSIRKPGLLSVTCDVTVEIEDEERPALSARWIFLVGYGPEAGQ